MSFETDTPIERRILARSLETLRKHAGMDMVFGGPVHHGAAAMEITDLTGVRTRSAVNLIVRNGEGLGGKALMLARPVSVADYFSAQGITHVYDHAVRPEAIETLAAISCTFCVTTAASACAPANERMASTDAQLVTEHLALDSRSCPGRGSSFSQRLGVLVCSRLPVSARDEV